MIGTATVSASILRAQIASRGPRISVTTYGADPTGRQDSTAAIRKAVRVATATAARGLVFPHGTYRLASVQELLVGVYHLSGFQLDGDGSTLLIGRDAKCIDITGCADVTVSDLNMDWNPLPFTQGTVVAADANAFTLRVDEGYPVPAHPEILAFATYDRSIKNFTKHPFEVYGSVSNVSPISESELRVQLTRPVSVPVGAVLVLRFKQTHETFRILGSNNITVRNVNLYSSGSLGFSISGCKDLHFEDVKIGMPADSDRLLSTNADGMHITSCTGSLEMQKCVFEGMGDDAINITEPLWRLHHDVLRQRTVIVKNDGTPVNISQLATSGDHLEILDPVDLHVLAHAEVALTSDNALAIRTEEGIDASGLDRAFVADPYLIPATQIVDSEFKGNRARAIVAHANLQVRNCSFRNTTGPAILLAPDSMWMEGPTTRNVTIESNHFVGCHYTSTVPEGSITIDVMHDYASRKALPEGEANNIRISDNYFESCPTAAITCRSADQLVIQNNRVGPTWTNAKSSPRPPAMSLSQLTSSSVTGNISTSPNTILIESSHGTLSSGNREFTVLLR